MRRQVGGRNDGAACLAPAAAADASPGAEVDGWRNVPLLRPGLPLPPLVQLDHAVHDGDVSSHDVEHDYVADADGAARIGHAGVI